MMELAVGKTVSGLFMLVLVALSAPMDQKEFRLDSEAADAEDGRGCLDSPAQERRHGLPDAFEWATDLRDPWRLTGLTGGTNMRTYVLPAIAVLAATLAGCSKPANVAKLDEPHAVATITYKTPTPLTVTHPLQRTFTEKGHQAGGYDQRVRYVLTAENEEGLTYDFSLIAGDRPAYARKQVVFKGQDVVVFDNEQITVFIDAEQDETRDSR
jgi:hypothetical protein